MIPLSILSQRLLELNFKNLVVETKLIKIADLYVNEFWEDPALNYEVLFPCNGNLSFDHSIQESIWIPNTCFINSKKALIHSSPFRNVFLMVFPNGKHYKLTPVLSFIISKS